MIRFIHSFAKTNDKELCRRDHFEWHDHIYIGPIQRCSTSTVMLDPRPMYINTMDTCTAAANLIHFFNYIHMFKNCTLV